MFQISTKNYYLLGDEEATSSIISNSNIRVDSIGAMQSGNATEQQHIKSRDCLAMSLQLKLQKFIMQIKFFSSTKIQIIFYHGTYSRFGRNWF